MNVLEDALSRFLEQNPDLPEGGEPVAEKVENPARQELHVLLEKKGRGGKVATIVEGFTFDDRKVAEVASLLKKKLGTGGSSRGGEILIQGDRREDVARELRAMGHRVKGVK